MTLLRTILCLLLLPGSPAFARAAELRSPFAEWAADVASPALRAAAPFLGREVRFAGPHAWEIDRGRPLCASLDRSGPLVGADRAHDAGRTGRGVLVAVIDSGVDFTHSAFLDDAGRPRILWYLDMTLPTRGTAGPLDDLGYALFDREDLARALADPAAPRPSPDEAGHGTRVASIAVGGREPYLGIAPDAELLVVRADRLPGGRYDEADVADAIRFAFAAADLAARPCVVNLSLGGQAGAHDGTSWLERTIDEYAWNGPGGRAVVVAAGNDAEAAVHAVLAPQETGRERLSLVIPAHRPLAEDAPALVLVDLWSAPDRSFSAAVRLPDDTTLSVSPDFPAVEQPLADGAALRLQLSPPATHGRRTEALLAVTGGDHGTIPPGRYEITVSADAPVDAWLTAEAVPEFLPFRLEGDVREEGTLAIPATARGALAVGSIVSRTGWVNHLGDWLENTTSSPSGPSTFSAWGPTADGRFKPDVLAPGEWILAAQSGAADVPLGPGGRPATAPDPRWAGGRGTSLAAPHVSGAVALVFQQEPWIHARDLLDRLRATASGPGNWTPPGGFGVLDVFAALLPPPAARARDRAAVVVSLARVPLPHAAPRTTEVAVVLRAADGTPRFAGPVSFRLPSTLAVRAASPGSITTATVDGSRLPPGACSSFRALAPPAAETSSFVCAAPAPFRSGCGVAGPPRGSAMASLLLLLAVGGLRRVRLARSMRAVSHPRAHGGRSAVRWPFLLASLAAHVLALLPLAALLPAGTIDPRTQIVAVSLLAAPQPPRPILAPPRPPSAVRAMSSQSRVALQPDPPAPATNEPQRRRPPHVARAAVSAVASALLAPSAGTGPPPGSLAVPTTTSQAAGALSLAAGTAAGPQEMPGVAEVVTLPARSPSTDPCTAAAPALRRAVDSQMRYPSLALRRRLTGTTVVGFALASDGTLAETTVLVSSGSALLDDAALAAVRNAGPFPAGGCRFELPVNFRLDE